MHWVYRTVISGTQAIIIPLQPIALGATSEVHWFYGPLISIYYSRVSWNERYHSLENCTHAVSNRYRNSNITADLDTYQVITISQQIYTHDFPGKNDNFVSFGNSIPGPVVNDKLLSHLRTSIRKMILLVAQPINDEYAHPPLLCNQ